MKNKLWFRYLITIVAVIASSFLQTYAIKVFVEPANLLSSGFTWHKEEITNFFPILLKHKIATGTFKTISPKEVEKLKPYNEVIRSIKIATPVKPLDNRLAGSTKTLIAYVCKKEDAITATIVIRYRNQSLFFIILISLIFQLIPY